MAATRNLPEFDENGDLPSGVYPVTLAEAVNRFGKGSRQRQLMAARLVHLHQLASTTGYLARFVVFGSFVTSEPHPRDVDIVLIMDDAFDLAKVTGEAAIIFRHNEADSQLGASVFWSTRSGAFGGEQAMVEHWQTRREGGLRGILEIVSERKP